MNYRRANTVLLVLIIAVNGYILAAPFWPQLVSWWQLNHTNQRQQLQALVDAPAPPPSANKIPNHIVIPDMALNAKIGDGSYANRYQVLHKGIWRDGRGSTPDQPGNTVLAGHRFTYTQPRGVLYSLNKVRVGSDIAVFWNNSKYRYRVREIKTVNPNDTSIQNPTQDKRLTIYTCTPLYHPTKRLVVIATEVTP